MRLADVEHPVRVLGSLDLIKAEYRDMPGLSLTPAQMQRMWGLDAFVCEALIDALVSARVLRKTDSGGYVDLGSAH
jgi:hypothetical protein